jgi:hypothetical protein
MPYDREIARCKEMSVIAVNEVADEEGKVGKRGLSRRGTWGL